MLSAWAVEREETIFDFLYQSRIGQPKMIKKHPPNYMEEKKMIKKIGCHVPIAPYSDDTSGNVTQHSTRGNGT
ncbi:hypothetical protein PGTUg99_020279 [Puccinia graminis f. sp. tritici]|uniref:Uncharacterized protein n=1 Tax=Puccinia graminis f. sp. tritici TaxID=56615 RepID=A0A5B0M3X3_PUCGR|nr:hypothetical protein PGTUg99_020279 [Puccinia graminis f. sp. tritici]